MTAGLRFGIFVYDDVEPVDLGGTFGTLSMARRVCPEITMFTVAKQAGPVVLTNGLTVLADHGFDDCPPMDYLLVSGGPGWPGQSVDPAVAEFLRRFAGEATVAGICTGGMIVAAAGLLDGQKATTKTNVSPGEKRPIDLLAETHPEIDAVEALVVDGGKVVTGGGVTLAIDTTLHLLARCLGEDAAQETARIMEYHIAWQANRNQRRSYDATK